MKTKTQIAKLETRIKDMSKSFFILCFVLLIMAGGMSNLNVEVVNGGKMPVYTAGILQPSDNITHFAFQDKNQVNFFYSSDIIKIGKSFFSFGDFMIFIGIGAILYNVVYQVAYGFKKWRKQ